MVVRSLGTAVTGDAPALCVVMGTGKKWSLLFPGTGEDWGTKGHLS